MTLFGDSDGGGKSSLDSDDEYVNETSEDESIGDMNESDGGDELTYSEEDDVERLGNENNDNPAERVFSELGRVLEKRRLRMKDSLFSSLMFLSDCNL